MLRIGIIGSGFGVIGLLPAFASIPGCRVVAVCAKSSEQLETQRKKFGFPVIYSDWRLMLKHELLDAVAIAVTPRAQYDIAREAILKGLHVFAEKPLAVDVRHARQLVALAEEYKVTHGVDFIFQEIAEWRAVKKLLDRGVLGALRHLSVDWDFLGGAIHRRQASWKTSIAEGGGALAFYFSHGLYYLEYLAGTIATTKCIMRKSAAGIGDGEVGADMLLTFAGGATGHAHISCETTGYIAHRIVLQCEKGVIILENRNAVVDKFSVVIHDERGMRRLKIRKDSGRRHEDERVSVVRRTAKRFVEACARRGQITPSFREGLRVQQLIESIRRDAKVA